MDDQCKERLTRLEAFYEDALRYRDKRESEEVLHRVEIRESMHGIRESVGEVSESISSQKSFIAGITFVIGSVAFVVSLFADKLFGNG